MTIIVLNGVTYDTATLTAENGFGYAKDQITGTTETFPFYLAPMVDALADVANAHITTSTSSVTVGTGSKVFVLAAVIPLVAGETVFVVDRDAPTTNTMFGTVTTWVSGTKTATINVDVTAGSGTLSNWDFVGKVGLRGPAGVSTDINGLAAEPLIESTDERLFFDASAGANRKISVDDDMVFMESWLSLFI